MCCTVQVKEMQLIVRKLGKNVLKLERNKSFRPKMFSAHENISLKKCMDYVKICTMIGLTTLQVLHYSYLMLHTQVHIHHSNMPKYVHKALCEFLILNSA
jgi:hypothetical protein